MRKRLAILATIVAPLAYTLSSSTPAYAGVNCTLGPDGQQHACYSNLQGTGTTFYGLYMTQNRANLTTPAGPYPQYPYHVGSAMWLGPDLTFNTFAEMGTIMEWDPLFMALKYSTYYFYWPPNGAYQFKSIDWAPPDGRLDAFQIQRGPNWGTWLLQYAISGQPWFTYATTPNLGFWSGQGLAIGGEVYSSDGHADTFNINSLAQISGGQWSHWGTQGGYITGYGQLNGFSYSNSEWSWNTVR